MARVPPHGTRGMQSGPLATKHLPNTPNARSTWKGPPYQRSKGRWSGNVDHGGTKHSVGTFDTPRLWGEARDAKLVALRAAGVAARVPSTPLEGVTIAQFVGHDGEGWPWEFNPQGKRRQPHTMRHHEQCIRPAVNRFGNLPIKGGLSIEEAALWANGATENQLTSVIAMFNDANRRDRTVINPFDGLTRPRTRGRSEMPDVLNEDDFALMREVAVSVHRGLYAPVMDAMILVQGTSGPRPGELWAFERAELSERHGEYYISQAVKKDGRLGPPKYNQTRRIVLAPESLAALLRVPPLHERWLLPTKTGRLMTQSNWTTYWHPVRDAFTAQLPQDHWLVRRIVRCTEEIAREPDPAKRRRMDDGKFDFYELRHRAITRMVTPSPHGLGMAAPDVAYQVGHRDGGRLIERVYAHRNPDLARARLKKAMGYELAPPSPDETAGTEHEAP